MAPPLVLAQQSMEGTIGELSAEDLTLLLGFLDALVTKNRLKALAGGVS